MRRLRAVFLTAVLVVVGCDGDSRELRDRSISDKLSVWEFARHNPTTTVADAAVAIKSAGATGAATTAAAAFATGTAKPYPLDFPLRSAAVQWELVPWLEYDRIIVTGPARSGVSFFAAALASYLRVQHVDAKQTYMLTDKATGAWWLGRGGLLPCLSGNVSGDGSAGLRLDFCC